MKKLLLALGASLAFTQVSSAITIDFEDIQAGTIVDDEYNILGATISAFNFDNGLNLAVAFDTNNPTGGDDDLGSPFVPGPGNDLGNISPGNVLIIQENDNCDALTCSEPDDEGSRPAGQFVIEFEVAINLESIDFFDIELPESGPTDDNLIQLFNANGDLIDLLFYTPETGGDNQWVRSFFDVEGVSRIEINMGGSGAIDNITYSQVPVPGALILFASALGGFGFMRKRA
ncbi:MAG: PEP-CTERM sorting domain-containing protein [Gammaproteobacteria bacterium]